MKTALGVAIGAIVAVVGVYFAWLNPAVSELEQSLKARDDAVVELSTRLSEEEARSAQLKTQNEALEEAYDSLHGELSTRVADLSGDLETLQQFSECEQAGDFTPDYSGNTTMATALSNFLGDISGNVVSNDWEVVWSNAKPSIHNLYTDAKYVFVVFYDEPNFGNSEGVFWVGQQCWLDLPD